VGEVEPRLPGQGRYGREFSGELERWTLDDPKLGGHPTRAKVVHALAESAWRLRFGRLRETEENLISRETGSQRWCLRERMRDNAKPDNRDIFVEIHVGTREAIWCGWQYHREVLRWRRQEIGTLWLVSGPMEPMRTYGEVTS
jgi:hypothetical protein